MKGSFRGWLGFILLLKLGYSHAGQQKLVRSTLLMGDLTFLYWRNYRGYNLVLVYHHMSLEKTKH